MKTPNDATRTALLPQYAESAAFMERFLVAAHTEGAPIERSANTEKIKLVDGKELDADVLMHFIKNRDRFHAEFASELRGRIGAQDFDLFCEVVSKEWFDGKRLRERGRARSLKRSVHDYLCQIGSKTHNGNSFVQTTDIPTDVEPLIPVRAIAVILTVNDQMLHRHIEDWKASHPNADSLSDDDVFLRRGLALPVELDTTVPFREWHFINSYSIAFSSPEKFSQMTRGAIPAIVNGDLGLFGGRVLFFSPFVPGMEVGQLEFGIIPSEAALPIRLQGRHGGILEYILDPAPFQIRD